jgi:hypothetical protein
MRKSIYLALLLATPAICGAADISIGGVALTIPDPKGFTPITQQMTTLYDLEKQFVAPSNTEYVAFIPEETVAAVMKGDLSHLARRFTVQTANNLVGASVSAADFMKLKNTVKTQNNELLKKVEAQMPGMMKKLNEGFQSKYNIDPAFAVSQMLPMPVHEETDKTLAYSALVKYDMKDANGKPAPFVIVVTTTFAYVKGKILLLYCYAEESGVEWSRESARQWGNAIVAANPSDRKITAMGAMPTASSGFDWKQVGSKALIGGLIGLVIGLISWAMKRGKES